MRSQALLCGVLSCAIGPGPRALAPRLDASSRAAATRSTKRLRQAAPPAEIEKDKHLHFDQADVVVRAGSGGHGQVIDLPARGDGPMLPRDSDGELVLPAGGGRGGDIVLVVDPALGDLLHLRARREIAAQRGSDSLGLGDVGRARRKWRDTADIDGGEGGAATHDAPDLVIGVPAGTFVRTKAGKPLGDLVTPGQRLVVAEGGAGGPCVLGEKAPSKGMSGAPRRGSSGRGGGDGRGKGRGRRRAEAGAEEDFVLSDAELKELTRGRAGKQVGLQLLLRTVADVG